MFNEMTNIYVVKIFSKEDGYIIKVGRSINVEERIKNYKSVSPEVEVLLSVYKPKDIESEFIEMLSNNFKRIGRELFNIYTIELDNFVTKCCDFLDVNGSYIGPVNFEVITGCKRSHYRSSYFWDHMWCNEYTCSVKKEIKNKEILCQ